MDMTDPGVVAVVIERAQPEMPSLTATCFVAGYCVTQWQISESRCAPQCTPEARDQILAAPSPADSAAYSARNSGEQPQSRSQRASVCQRLGSPPWPGRPHSRVS
jgi:hypothetical protein